ncbi:zinc finger protein CONSTANS-LIKE 4-like [Asparagus officinalis]|uniref:zinc finger protein CONSTANS-LIKE 4-like n=1 Tax=Asparagus officinalis TaxID=4686 RepID=UPI00098E75B8|nr:zinc finger protein CONSTANS-LIKE 4-like [Asparagus officinalis]
MSGGDRQMGLFHGRTMAGAEAGMGAEGGGFGSIYGLESTQRVYNSLDMQVIGDYKNLVDGCNSNHTTLSTSDIAPLDDSTLKVGRLSPEERKEKIHRYLKKRSERNFNKKIKYACRKTLADSRPRVRGRFAKNDEHGEGSTRTSSSNHEYLDEGEVAVIKEEDDILNSSDIFSQINGVNSFNYNYTIESWI